MSAPVYVVTWSCSRKVGYSQRGQVRRAKRRLEQRTRARYKIYRCSFCGLLHLAHRRFEA